MKTSISQCYVDSSHQISCYELLVWKMKKFNENNISQCYVDMKTCMKNEINLMKTSNVTLIVHIKYLLGTSCMKNEINLMKTSISQCYVDSSHQISCYELLVWKMK